MKRIHGYALEQQNAENPDDQIDIKRKEQPFQNEEIKDKFFYENAKKILEPDDVKSRSSAGGIARCQQREINTTMTTEIYR